MQMKRKRNFILLLITAAFITSTLCGCSNERHEQNSGIISSPEAVTNYTDEATPKPQTDETPDKEYTESPVASETTVYITDQTITTSQAEATTPVPETSATTPQTTTEMTTTVATTPAPETTTTMTEKPATEMTTTTQTTTPKPQTEKPSNVEQIELTVYTVKPMVRLYLDEDCSEIKVARLSDGTFVYSDTGKPLDKLIGTYSWMDCEGTAVKVVEYNKEKKCYKREDGLYVKSSDVTKTNPVETMYHYPFDFDAIRQYVINDAINNYGLVLDEKLNPDNCSWFPPTQVCQETPAWIFKRNIEGDEYNAGQVEASVDNNMMAEGQAFNVYIERIEIDNEDRLHKVDYNEAWNIYFLRG